MDLGLKCDVEDILLAYGEAQMKLRLLEEEVQNLRELLAQRPGDEQSDGRSSKRPARRAGLQSQ